MDGWITIGTKLDSKQLDRDLKDAQRRLQQFERENEKLTTAKSKVELDLQAYEKQKLAIQESTNEMLKFVETEEQVNNVLSMEEIELNKLNQQYSEQFQKIEEINQKLQENVNNQGLVKNQIQGITQQLNKTSSLDNIKKSVDNIGNSVEGVIKKVGKWALAVFGVRSAYMFIRQSMSTLSQYNEQMATDVEYIRYALASSLQPVIEWIIQLVYQLLSLIGSVAKALFGVNIFANASADAFARAKKSLGGANKEAKELQKTLAGFDEMNILQEDGSTKVGGGGGGISTPSFDFADMGEFDTSSIYTWTDKVKEIITNTFDRIKVNVKKVMIDMGFSPEYIGAWEQTVNGIEQTIGGLVDSIGGILEIIVGLFEGDTAKVEEGIIKTAIGIVNIIKGIGNTIMGIWKQAGVAFYDTLIKPIVDNFSRLPEIISIVLQTIWIYITGKFQKIKDFISLIFSNIGTILTTVASKVGEAISWAIKAAINGILNAVEKILNVPIKAINKLIDVINVVPGVDLGKLPTFNLPRLAKGGIINMPGNGVMVGSAIVGERGQEGVIPLTDSQQMALLGEAIGKYININATVPVYIGNRQVAREIRKIDAEDNFAYNG